MKKDTIIESEYETIKKGKDKGNYHIRVFW